MTDYEDYLYVPKERLGVLIGESGATKRAIEKLTGVELVVNSDTGEVNVERDENDDASLALKAKDMVRAIAVGFSEKDALKLIKEDYYFGVVDLEDYCKDSKTLQRQKARLIGTKGKARRMLEEMTNTNIAVGEKEVGVIGVLEDVELARKAVADLLVGVPHGDVYRGIQKTLREM